MNKGRWFNFFIFITAAVYLILSIVSIDMAHKHAWNNGHCYCGGEYRYEQLVGGPMYLYECDKCGNVYESRRKMR